MFRLLFIKLLPMTVAAYGIKEGVQHGSMFTEEMVSLATDSMAQYEIGAIGRVVAAECVGEPFKIPPEQFSQWLRETIGTDKGSTRSVEMDRFGHPYELESREGRLFIRSHGPDGEPRNADDVVVEVDCGS